MTLLNAPEYDKRKEVRNTRIFLGVLLGIFLAAVVYLAGYFSGHGWFFSDLPAEWKVSSFFTALEQGDYARAYGIKMNDAQWQQHPDKYKDYTFKEFTEDWTTGSQYGLIHSHHVDISKRVGAGSGASIVVEVRVNGVAKTEKTPPISVCVSVSDKTLIDCPIGLSY
jgi:hypothetical protein